MPALQEYTVWWDRQLDDAAHGRRWAAEHSKRYLAAQIAVGSVDQAMMAALNVRHSHMRDACLARNLLIVDEVHASDTYMGAILCALLDAHISAGGHAALMSATLGSAARRKWLSAGRAAAEDVPLLEEAIAEPYPAVSTWTDSGERVVATGENGREKTVEIESLPLMNGFATVAQRALSAARAGAKVLVVRNTVDYAVRTQQAIETAAAELDRRLLFDCAGQLTLHHGRFAPPDRRLLDLLQRGVNGLNQYVYQDLRIIEATRRLILQHSEWVIPDMNRELVERATHPEALAAVVDELGDDWRIHATEIEGGVLAEGLTARSAIVRRDRSFCRENEDVQFGSIEERIRTRLGDEGIEFELDLPQPSPFGTGMIARMSVPRRWLGERWDDAAAPAHSDSERLTFRVGSREFDYERLGLRRKA